jgi:putative transposase
MTRQGGRGPACDYEANADLNAARNILAAGDAVLACGEPVLSGRSAKQEPTEATKHEFAHA